MLFDPLDLAGGPFLRLYMSLLVIVILAGLFVPRFLRENGRPGAIVGADRLALLTGGLPRMIDAVVTRMLASGALRMVDSSTFAVGAPGAVPSTPERTVLALSDPIRWPRIQEVLRPHAAKLEDELIAAGSMIGPDTTASMRRWQTAPYFMLMALGVAKWIVGTARDKPVGYLTALLIVTAVFAVWRWRSVDRVTRAGRAAVADARRNADRLRRAPTANEADMAVALFGTAVLAGSGWAAYHQMRTASSGSDGGSSSSSGGDSGCGDGGGGGGCGGCGGGGD